MKETVIAGNCPWCVMERAWVVVSKCEKVLRGSALAVDELVAPAEPEPMLDVEVTVLEVRAFGGGAIVLADGVNKAEPVSALEPAEVDPFPEDDEAGAPLWPTEEFD